MIKSLDFLKDLYFSIPYSLRLGKTYYRTKEFLYKEQWSSIERIKSWQLHHYKRIIAYAYQHCPGYYFLYKDAGFDPNNISSLDDVHKVPIVTKSLLVDNIIDFRSTDPRLLSVKYQATSGSSGAPLKFYSNEPYDYERDIAFIHFGWEQTGWRLGDRKAVLNGSFKGSNSKIYSKSSFDNSLLLSIYYLCQDTFSQYLAILQSETIRYLHGWPSAIENLAKLVTKNKAFSELNISSIFLASEMNYSHQLDLFKSAFPNACIHAHYGNTEQSVLAHWNSEHEYEFNPFYGLSSYLPTDFGYNIISTSFTRKATPFINYLTDDLCTNLSSSLISSHSFVKATTLLGRSHETLITEEGTIIGSGAFSFHDNTLEHIKHFRIIQHSYTELTLELSFYDYFSPDPGYLQMLVDKMTQSLPESFVIQFKVCSDIPALPSGKRSLIVSNIL